VLKGETQNPQNEIFFHTNEPGCRDIDHLKMNELDFLQEENPI